MPTQVLGERRADARRLDRAGLVGRTIDGRYRVVRSISGGAMGFVYEARQAPFDRRVALKVLSNEGDHRFEVRFRREASIAARLAHPNIVTIFDYGRTADGRVYMVMEYLEGRSLQRVLREDGPLPLRRALGITIQLARALRKAHAQGVVHRDLKPSNIMLVPTEDTLDFVKVLDFGLVKLFEPAALRAPSLFGEHLTAVGAMLGTPGYMSPEQAMGEGVDARTDVYACGVVLFELLTGKLPFEAETLPELISRQVVHPLPALESPAARAELSAEVRGLLADMLHRDRTARPESADILLARLKRIWRQESDESLGTEASLAHPLGSSLVQSPMRDAAGPGALEGPGVGRRPAARGERRRGRRLLLIGTILLVLLVLLWQMLPSPADLGADPPARFAAPEAASPPSDPAPEGYKDNPY